jgi:hypothetical protein
MSLKIGDKVRMTRKGFKFHSNLNISFEMHSVCLSMEHKHFTSAVCELFAIHGVGTIKGFNDYGDPYIRWDFRMDGIKYHYEHYFDSSDIKKLTLLDEIIFKLKGAI